MKRLFTIFLSSIVCIGLWGQQPKLPMTVIGDVHIADNGKMVSEGAVHLQALDLNRVGRVANYGDLEMDTIIFYSNDLNDGLLMNQTPGDVTASQVAARKTFIRSNVWYMMAFPFEVNLSGGIKNPINGATLTRGTHFEVQAYNPLKRATRGLNDELNWETYPADSVTLHKGEAYRIAVKLTTLIDGSVITDTIGAYLGRFSLDFYAKTANDIEFLFEPQAKGFNLTYASDPFSIFGPGGSDGWNAIGGLNSTNFFISNSTVNYIVDPDDPIAKKIVYYWSYGPMWEEIWLQSPVDNSGTLRPYAPIFLKTNIKTRLDRSAGGGFAYLNGITLESTAPVFRASQRINSNVLGLWLTNKKDDSKRSRIFFDFTDNASRFFSGSKDGVRQDTWSDEVPIVWSLTQSETRQMVPLFVKGIPYSANEVSLGVNIPATGEYVFSLEEFMNDAMVTTAVLWDKVTNSKTDLLKQDYSFQVTGSLNKEDRFVIIFGDVITSIDPSLRTSSVYAYTDNNILTVKNLLQGDKIQVYDLAGRIIASGIASGDSFSATLNQKGVYIVNARGGEKILKVVNK